jgi:fatty acid synthase subunit alpha
VKEIYYQQEDELEVETPAAEAPSSKASPTPAAIPVAAPLPVESSGPVASIECVPAKAIEILLVIVAQKLKKTVDKVRKYDV